MSNPTITTTFGAPDPNTTVLNLTELFALAKQLVSSQMEGAYIPYILGSQQPGVDDQDKAWIRLDTVGRPIGIFTFYQGNWRRVYNGMSGEIKMYAGSPVDDFGTDWQTNGRGVIGGQWDGWALCNGQNGTPDLSDKFIIAGHMNGAQGQSGWTSGGWQTFVDGTSDLHSGGTAWTTLTENQTYRPATAGVKMDRYTAGGNENSPSGDLWGLNSVQHIEVVPADPGNTNPSPFTNLPPFITLAFVLFLGY